MCTCMYMYVHVHVYMCTWYYVCTVCTTCMYCYMYMLTAVTSRCSQHSEQTMYPMSSQCHTSVSTLSSTLYMQYVHIHSTHSTYMYIHHALHVHVHMYVLRCRFHGNRGILKKGVFQKIVFAVLKKKNTFRRLLFEPHYPQKKSLNKQKKTENKDQLISIFLQFLESLFRNRKRSKERLY